MLTEAQKRANYKYNAAHKDDWAYMKVCFSTKEDMDVYEYLKSLPSQSRSAYIRDLIREDMKKGGA